MVNQMFGALNGDKDIRIERLPVEGDEEIKFAVTIKKQLEAECLHVCESMNVGESLRGET